MKKSVMKKWVKALRSGKYKQGSFQLAEETLEGDMAYCCLGVLCELSGFSYDVNDPFPPEEVAKWAGLKNYDEDGEASEMFLVPYRGKKVSLVNLNDGGRGVVDAKSFKQIALYIERNWETL